MAVATTVEVSVVAKGAEEMQRMAKAIAGHYLAIADVHMEMAQLRAKHDQEEAEEIANREWTCPNCAHAPTCVGPAPCSICGTPSPMTWPIEEVNGAGKAERI